MQQLVITLKGEKKIDILRQFLESIECIEKIEPLEEENHANAKKEIGAKEALSYEPQLNYTLEDIENIAKNFPEDYHWTYSDLEKYFLILPKRKN